MSLEQQIDQDYIQAMKARDTARSSALSFLRSQIKYARIELRTEHVEDKEVIAVIKKQIKLLHRHLIITGKSKTRPLPFYHHPIGIKNNRFNFI